MRIDLFPQLRYDDLTIEVSGETIILNGTEIDLSDIPAGGTMPLYARDETGDFLFGPNGDVTILIDCPWICGDIHRDATGELIVPVTLPHLAEASEARRFPEPITVATDGPVALPE